MFKWLLRIKKMPSVCGRIYQETMGGGTTDRPELEKCLEHPDRGDTLVVWQLDKSGVNLAKTLSALHDNTAALLQTF